MEIEKLYRKRLIPDECILLKDDIIIYLDENMLITKWKTLKPRSDFHHGYSCYFFKEGYKISQFFKEDNSLLYWYCDIITCEYEASEKTLIVTDLLADVIVYPDKHVQVLDLDELCDAKEMGLINDAQFMLSLRQLHKLLDIIYDEKLNSFCSVLLDHIK